MIVGSIVMTAAAAAAAVLDLRTRRIPNALTGALALFAIALHAFNGPVDVGLTLATMLAVFVLGTALFAAGIFGGGDVKLLAACAGVVGPAHVVFLLCFIGIAGGVAGLLYAVRLGRLRYLLTSSALVLAGQSPVERIRMPYGVAIGAGSLIYTIYSVFILQ
jgi:prepilin peptidase CpaA